MAFSSAEYAGRGAICFFAPAMNCSVVQGVTVAGMPERRMISAANSHQEHTPSPVQWYTPYSLVTSRFNISWARSAALVGLPSWSSTTVTPPFCLARRSIVLTKLLPA